MIYRIAADLTAMVHLLFVIFVVGGGLLVLRWPRLIWVHLPAAVWGAWIEIRGGICPLTPLENWFRFRGGERGYAGGFVEHYLFGLLYPSGLDRSTQILLGMLVLAVNAVVYGFVVRRKFFRTS